MGEQGDLRGQEPAANLNGRAPGREQPVENPEKTVPEKKDPETGDPEKNESQASPAEPPVEEARTTPAREPVAKAEGGAQPSEPVRPAEGPSGPDEAEPDAEKPRVESPTVEEMDERVRAQSRRHTRRSFAIAAVAAAAGYSVYNWLVDGPSEQMQPPPMRRAFETNAAISRAIFQESAQAPTYALSRAENLRVNGVYGLKRALVAGSWRLQVVGVNNAQRHPRFTSDVTAWEYRYAESPSSEDHASEDQGHDTKTPPPSAGTAEKMAPASMVAQERNRENRAGRMPRGREEAGESRSTLPSGTGGLLLTMDDILQLPRRELVTQFKCIEGWSQIVHWAGVRMADFLEAYPPALVGGGPPRFVYMETPDGDYYAGYDMAACRHPQTLLVTEMMGAPLTQFHGAPLRLHMPIKYGYKQIKRIGLIDYTDNQPDDYWTELGYDWYAGL